MEGSRRGGGYQLLSRSGLILLPGFAQHFTRWAFCICYTHSCMRRVRGRQDLNGSRRATKTSCSQALDLIVLKRSRFHYVALYYDPFAYHMSVGHALSYSRSLYRLQLSVRYSLRFLKLRFSSTTCFQLEWYEFVDLPCSDGRSDLVWYRNDRTPGLVGS